MRSVLGVTFYHDNGRGWAKCDTGGNFEDEACQRDICAAIELASKGKYKNVKMGDYIILEDGR